MTPRERDEAARLLLRAARDGRRIEGLPQRCQPGSVAEALAIQGELVALSGEAVAGWKVAAAPDGAVMWGAILERDCFASPARIEAGRMPLMGVEGEIAFRFDRRLPARQEPYARQEIEEAVTAFPAIEIVDSRFASYRDAPLLDRLADRMSNGGMVCGDPVAGWRAMDLTGLPVTLAIDGAVTLSQTGGHARGDPLLPALDFVAAFQQTGPIEAGQFVTTGTVTGLVFGARGQGFAVHFPGFGHVEVRFA